MIVKHFRLDLAEGCLFKDEKGRPCKFLGFSNVDGIEEQAVVYIELWKTFGIKARLKEEFLENVVFPFVRAIN